MYDPKMQEALIATIKRTDTNRFTVEQKESINAMLKRESTTDAKKSLVQKLINIARVILEDSEEWGYIPKEVDQIAESTWQPFNVELRDAAVNAVITRTEYPGAKHFTM